MTPVPHNAHDPNKPSMLFIAVCIVGAILGQALQNLSLPMWFASMDPKLFPHRDAFMMLMVIAMWYPPMFFVSACVARLRAGRPVLGFIHKFSTEQQITLSLTGLSNVLAGVFIITSSPSDRTPAIIASLIATTTMLPMIVIKHFYFEVSGVKLYKERMFGIMLTTYLCASYTIIYPLLGKEEGLGGSTQVWWWIAYFIGAIFANFYNIQQVEVRDDPDHRGSHTVNKVFGYSTGQEYSFKLWDHHESMTDYFEYLFYQTSHMCLWGWALVWLDLVPGLGSAHGVQGLMLAVYDTFAASFYSPALNYNASFNISLYVSYIVCCYINKADALIGTLINVAVPAIVAAISYPIDALTPDRSVVMIGLVPLTIALFGLSTFAYDVWSREQRPYDGPSQQKVTRTQSQARATMSYNSLPGSSEEAGEKL
eukprot:gene31638-6833_t